MTALTSLADERRSRRAFTSADVVQIAGITYRQLDHWWRSRLVQPEQRGQGSGNPRWFSTDDTLRYCVIGALVHAGVGLASIREQLDTILEHGEVHTGDVTISVSIERLRTRVEQYRRAAS